MQFLDRFLATLKSAHDCDFIDRLNFHYTPVLLGFFALLLSTKQYAGQPIQCWIPAQFTPAWEQYSEYYCFVKNTYFVPFSEQSLPNSELERTNREIGYYQWVPFVLALQALFFFAPMLFWRTFSWQSGIWVKGLMNSVAQVSQLDEEKRRKSAFVVAKHLEGCVRVQKDLPGNRWRRFTPFGAHFGSYVSVVYLITKCLSLLNVLVQLWIMNQFLGTGSFCWGFTMMKDIWSGREWSETGHFPRVTMCDFKVRTLGNLHNWSLQCVLMINMFNEKIFVFLWWWFLFTTSVTLINLCYWIWSVKSKETRRRFLSRYLAVCENMRQNKLGESISGIMLEEKCKADVDFIETKLRPDMTFLLRLISTNQGDLVTVEVVDALFTLFQEKQTTENGTPREQQKG